MKMFKWLIPGLFANEYFTSYGGGGKGGGGSAPDYTPVAQASKEAAEIGAQLGREQLAENKRQYDLNYATLQPLVQESLKTQQLSNQQGAQNYANYQAEGRPTQQAMLYDALGLNADEIAQYNNMRSQAINTGKASWDAAHQRQLSDMDQQIARYQAALTQNAASSANTPSGYFLTQDGRLITEAQAATRPGNIFQGIAYNAALENNPNDGSILYGAGESGAQSYGWAKPFQAGASGSASNASQNQALSALYNQRNTLAAQTYNGADADTTASNNYLAQVTQAAKQRQLNEAADTALADSRVGSTQQQNQLMRQAARYGWAPEKLAAMEGVLAVGNTQNQVAAANAARTQADAKRTAKLGDVYNTYAGAMSSAPNFYNAGTNAANSANSSQLGMSGQYINGMNAGNSTIMQGQGMKVSGLGSVLNAQTSAYNAAQNASDPVMGLAGAALGGWASSGFKGAGTLASMFSDRRIKENITEVGKYENGLPMYEFNYIGDGTRYRGVMAQDVAEVFPDAVATNKQGVMSVDYGKLGIEMEKVNA